MRRIITAAAVVLAALTATLTAIAPASAAHHRPWPVACLTTGNSCLTLTRHGLTATPFTGAQAQWSSYAGQLGPALTGGCGPNQDSTVFAAPYWCPFRPHALDTQFAGRPWGLLGFANSGGCAGGSESRVTLPLCWEPSTFLVLGADGRFASIVASDAAKSARYLTVTSQGLRWMPPGSGQVWRFR